MKEVRGNIWDYYSKGNWIVITTNGNVKSNGKAVMGKGIALQAAKRFPKLPFILGKRIKDQGNAPQSFSEYRLLTLPTKRNWWEKADIELIEDMLVRLVTIAKWFSISDNKELNNVFPLYMVRPGCSNGQLDWEDVKPILEKYLDDRFIIVQL